MSRIDEALRLKRGDDGPAAAVDQDPFVEAWSLAEPVEPEFESAPALATPITSARPSFSSALKVVPATVSRHLEAVPSVGQGAISFSAAWRERLADGPEGDPGLVEQFRRLAATLHHAHQSNGLRSLVVTSAAPGDGKTMTAVNLALVLAKSYRYNVLLVDADLRRPSITSLLELDGGGGLAEALRAPTEQKLALVAITPRLTLLPAGLPIANSIEALTSPRMRQILDEAAARFDWVILDAPPVGPVADARLLTEMVGGTLFVVHAGRTQYPDVQRAIEVIGRDQILGVVLNAVEPVDAADYGRAYQAYGPQED